MKSVFHLVPYIRYRNAVSHPSRGAWIEIASSKRPLMPPEVAPLTGCVD